MIPTKPKSNSAPSKTGSKDPFTPTTLASKLVSLYTHNHLSVYPSIGVMSYPLAVPIPVKSEPTCATTYVALSILTTLTALVVPVEYLLTITYQ